MKIKGIDVVYVHTAHPELAKWYAQTLGLEPGYGDEAWQELALPQGRTERFGLDFTGFPRSTVERQPIMISFAVEDIEAAVQELAAKGVPLYPDAERAIFDVGPARVATFADPDGNWVQLSEAKH